MKNAAGLSAYPVGVRMCELNNNRYDCRNDAVHGKTDDSRPTAQIPSPRPLTINSIHVTKVAGYAAMLHPILLVKHLRTCGCERATGDCA
jgi:hypothetical protein